MYTIIRQCNLISVTGIHLQFMDMSANPIVGPNEIGKLNDGDTSTCAALDRSDMTKALILKGDTIPAQNINILVTARDVDFHVSRTCAPTQMVFHQLTPTGKHTERAVMCTEQPGNNASHYLLTCNCTPSFCNNVTIFISYTSFEADFGYLCAVNIIYLWAWYHVETYWDCILMYILYTLTKYFTDNSERCMGCWHIKHLFLNSA